MNWWKEKQGRKKMERGNRETMMPDEENKEVKKMEQEEKKLQEKQKLAYQQYVEEVTPKAKLLPQMGKAFITGGIICALGQWIKNIALYRLGFSQELAGGFTSLCLIGLSVLLTGLHWYPAIAKWGGAGILVPITGFANSISSAAIEYKKEGQVFGIGSKIFTIAGPVILYGIVGSWIFGVLYWIGLH